MNRSSSSQLMFMLLRAWNKEYGMNDGKPHHFGKQELFDMRALVRYHKSVNLVGRYPVLTNTTFVKMLLHAAKFEALIHKPKFAGWLELRRQGHLKEVATAFAVFVEEGDMMPLSPEQASRSPDVSVALNGSTVAVPAPPRPQKKKKHRAAAPTVCAGSLATRFPTLCADTTNPLSQPFSVRHPNAVHPVSLFPEL
jgi:hypothetical protein